MFEPDTRILLVEDTEITRAIVKKMLDKMGFRKVTETCNGLQAWEEIQKSIKSANLFRLVIADWNMPEMNGLELLRKIQELSVMRSTPFVMLTSNIEKDQVVDAINAGVNSYLAKPFPASALERKLKEAWEFSQRKRTG